MINYDTMMGMFSWELSGFNLEPWWAHERCRGSIVVCKGGLRSVLVAPKSGYGGCRVLGSFRLGRLGATCLYSLFAVSCTSRSR